MSDTKEVTYFRCQKLLVTMPVTDCKVRRERAKRTFYLYDKAKVPLFVSACRRCEAWKEWTAPENLISHDEMMQRLRDNPSQGAGNDQDNSRFRSLSTESALRLYFHYWYNEDGNR